MRAFIIIFTTILSLGAYADGQSLLTEKCSRCHATPDAQKYSAEKWGKLVDKMAPNAKLSEEEIEQVKALNQ